MLKNENATEWAKRIDSSEEGAFLEDEEFDEMFQLLMEKGGWKGIIDRWKEKGYSEFKIGYTVGELKRRIDDGSIPID